MAKRNNKTTAGAPAAKSRTSAVKGDDTVITALKLPAGTAFPRNGRLFRQV